MKNLEKHIQNVFAVVSENNPSHYGDIFGSENEANQEAKTNAEGFHTVRKGYVVVDEQGNMFDEAKDIHFHKETALAEAKELVSA